MKPYILQGTPRDVAQQIEHISATKVVAMLVVEDAPVEAAVSDDEFLRVWSDMEKDMVAVGHVDDSREAIYTRMAGE